MPGFARVVVSAGCSLLAASLLHAQRGVGDWMTIGNDAQRSNWIRGDGKISIQTMQKAGFELVWKLKLNNEARQLNSLTPPALLDFYISYRGFRTLGFVGGSSENVIGIDTDLARIEWERSLGEKGSRGGGTILCPGGMTSSITRPTSAGYPPATAGGGAGRGTAAKSGVGEPNEGAVTLRNRPVPFTPPPPPTGPAARRTAPPPNPFARQPLYVLAVTADGKLHSMYVSNGEEPKPPVQFLPPNAHALGLISFTNTAYVATVNGCGGVENGVWAINLETGQISQWKAGADGVAGAAGFAAGPEGTLFVAAGNRLVSLEPGTLKQKDSYSAGAEKFTSSPVVFEYKGKDLVAAATNAGRLHLLDSAALGAPVARSEPFSTADFATGALASWQDAAGTRWILAPAGGGVAARAGFPGNGDVKNGAIVSWKVVEKNGAAVLEPGWVSRDMISPLTPSVVNGVVFAVSSGAFRGADMKMTAAQRAQRSSKAVLYALDAATGKELWNSGTAITSFVHSGGLAAGGGRVYVASHDGTQYAFGFPMEH